MKSLQAFEGFVSVSTLCEALAGVEQVSAGPAEHYDSAAEHYDEAAERTRQVRGAAATVGNVDALHAAVNPDESCLLYTSPSPRDRQKSRMPSSA